MPNRTTNTRIKERERLQQRKEELREEIRNQQDAMQAILDLMNDDDRALVSAPGNAANDARVRVSGSLSGRGTVNTPNIAVVSLEEQLSKVEEELKGVEEQMSTKITNARIKRLEMLKQIKERAKAKIQRDQTSIQAVLDSMDGDDPTFVSARAKAANDARGKKSSSLSHQDTVHVFRIALERLEEDYSNVEEELKRFEDMELM